jgi:DNA mismatch endonuclease (patch repair protein)
VGFKDQQFVRKDRLTPEQRRKCMSNIRSSDTKPEIFFRKALWKWGIKYRKNVKTLFGKPDIAIIKYKLVIFIDGDYWHGNDWAKRGFSSQDEMLSSYSEYWQKKIKRNIERDIEVNNYYKTNKWTILRFWESDINKNLNKCIIKTIKAINRIRKKVQ